MRIREAIDYYKEEEKNRKFMTSVCNKNNWNVYKDSDLSNMLDDFGGVLPPLSYIEHQCNYARIIEPIFEKKNGQVVLLEMGGPARELAESFSKNFLKKSAGCTLKKGLSKEMKHKKVHNHTIIIGDMFLQKTKEKIDKWLDGDKVDILIERMQAGLDLIPRNGVWIWKQFNDWYKMVNEGGIMLIQTYSTPFSSCRSDLLVPDDVFEQWGKVVSQNKSLEFKSDVFNQHFLLRKLPGAPERLPVVT